MPVAEKTIALSDVFSPREVATIELCVKNGQYDFIPSALESIGPLEMTPEKEAAIQQYLDGVRPIDQFEESAVRAELTKKEQAGYRIETPEDEAYWQARFDAEAKEKEEKRAGIIKQVGGTPQVITEAQAAKADEGYAPDDLSEIELTKNEVMEELKAKGIPFKPAQSKAELVALLESSL